ncbi:uncharacterized protein LOC114730060 isoform X1 [Neltuma alba]|uniref:uncharacterized protein LOC114730060 isoform X1 n=3 Tax=Neltuma alba TaxID=207710 RepID=UPI0010A39A38|nr:uncharacterized protein LOC114730060 isoform X1 [Prosopis alba]
MATAPVKSQPLHNFSLPFLKWGGKNHTNSNHRFRRPVSGESSSSQAFAADHNSELEAEPETRAPRVGSRASRNRFGLSSCYLGEKSQKQEQQPQPLEGASYNETNDEVGGRKRENEDAEDAEADGTAQKPWNLRPRKSIFSRGTGEIGVGGPRNGELPENGSFAATGHSAQQNENPPQPKSLRLRGYAEMQNTERKEKRKFWIALSREEIEEDIFIMTGSRPSRRPKKRPKNVQKQLDSVFPGLWLVGFTADVCKAADTAAKK